jgi:hypothetical protein
LCFKGFTACDSVGHLDVAYVYSVFFVFFVHLAFYIVVGGDCAREVFEDAFVGLFVKKLGSQITGINVEKSLSCVVLDATKQV